MKTKIVIGSLLAVIMLVIVPVLTVTRTETTAEEKASIEQSWKETAMVETTSEETTSEDITSEDAPEMDTTVEEETEEEKTTKTTEYFPSGFVKARFLGVPDKDVDDSRGIVLKHDVFVTSSGDGTLSTPLKINGETIVESGTSVKIETDLMGPRGMRKGEAARICLSPVWHVDISGFALGITVTY